MRYFPLVGCGMVLGIACAAIAACSDTSPPAAGSSGYGGQVPVGPSSEAGTSGEGAADGASGACETTAQRGEVVAEDVIARLLPNAFGGSIQPGTYVLIELFVYTPPVETDAGEDDAPPPQVPSGFYARETLVVSGDSMRFFGARGMSATALPVDEGKGYKLVVSGTTLGLTASCPSSLPARDIPFSAIGQRISMNVDGSHRVVYARVDP